MVRFIVRNNYVVSGGLSRILKHVNEAVFTFLDGALFSGGGYTRAGFVLDKVNPSSLTFTNGTLVRNRRRFTNKAMQQWAKTFDPAKTQVDNAAANGWYALYGIGQDRYRWAP